jgi:hypothetical protein
MRDFFDFAAMFLGVFVIALIFWGIAVSLWMAWRSKGGK